MSDIPSLDGIVVLVVDDNPDSLGLITRVLASHGASVVTAANGLEALHIVEKNPPDVLLSDIWMPEMDGYTLMEKIRRLEQQKPIPAAAITGHTSVDARRKSSLAGFRVFIAKPIDVAELVKTVARLAGHNGNMA